MWHAQLQGHGVNVLFLSKNENNNGFDLVGLNSFSVIIGVWCFLSFSVVSCIVFPGCLL